MACLFIPSVLPRHSLTPNKLSSSSSSSSSFLSLWHHQPILHRPGCFFSSPSSFKPRHGIPQIFASSSSNPSSSSPSSYNAGTDNIARTISANGHISCKTIIATSLVNHATALHGTSPVASAALGRTLIACLLLAAGKKDSETTQIDIRSDGPLRGVFAIGNGSAQVRGYVGDPTVQLPPNPINGKLDVGKAVGRGVLSVVRNHPFWKNPYTGIVPITSGEIAEDVAVYLADSEQIPSAFAAGVFVDSKEEISAAAGFLVQVMPGASEESIATLERNVQDIKQTPSELALAGKSAEDIAHMLMRDLHPMQIVSTQPRYHCECSLDRVERTIALLSDKDINECLLEYGCLNVKCEFCGKKYIVSPEEARIIMQRTRNYNELDTMPDEQDEKQ